jgi:hypothetical protein
MKRVIFEFNRSLGDAHQASMSDQRPEIGDDTNNRRSRTRLKSRGIVHTECGAISCEISSIQVKRRKSI